MQALRGHRKKSEFAMTCGLSSQTLQHYENGRNFPSDDSLLRIAKICGVTYNWLRFGVDQPGGGTLREEPTEYNVRSKGSAMKQRQQNVLDAKVIGNFFNVLAHHSLEKPDDQVHIVEGLRALIPNKDLAEQAVQNFTDNLAFWRKAIGKSGLK